MAKIKVDHFRAINDERVKELESQLRESEANIRDYRKDHGKLEVFFDRVLNAIKPIPPLPSVYKPKNSKGKNPCVAVMQNTDWHTGEVQDAAEIEFINAYSPEIQLARIKEMDAVFLRWCETMRAGYLVDRCHVIVTGDLISGDIHLELTATNAYPVPVQVCEAAKMLAMSIGTKAQAFEQVTVDFIVPDNHARLTKKPQAKESGQNSFNYLVGILAQQYLAKHKNVTFNVHTEIEKVIEVNGMRYLCSHGNNIVGWMGVPWYSIERHIGKEAKARQFLIMQEIERAKVIGFNKYLFGHWHTHFDNEFYACGASLSGTSAYDHAAGRYSPPGQPIWLVHSKHGELNKTNIRLA